MYGELTRIDMLEKEKAQLLQVTEAAREFIEAWDRFYKVEPGSPGEQAAEDLACVRMEILKEAVTEMTKGGGGVNVFWGDYPSIGTNRRQV